MNPIQSKITLLSHHVSIVLPKVFLWFSYEVTIFSHRLEAPELVVFPIVWSPGFGNLRRKGLQTYVDDDDWIEEPQHSTYWG